MSDDDFLSMAKDQQDAKHSKQVAQQVTDKSGKKQPGPPADQQPPYGKGKGGKGK